MRSTDANARIGPHGRLRSGDASAQRPRAAERTIRVERDGDVAVLLLDRPPANAYDHRLLRDLGDALDALRVDEQVRGVVVRSASGRYFCAGADVGTLAAGSPRQRAALCVLAHEVFRKIELTPLPVAAAIAGHALGGGLELALSCDARFVAEGEHRIGLPEIELGLFPGSGATQRLPRLIGLSAALDIILSGRILSPREALAAGIVDELLPDPNACLAAATAYVRSASAQKWTGHQGGG